jgi:hypothetical protein
MSRALLIAGMALLVAWSTEASANLIVNGDFETGSAPPWTISGDVVIDTSQPFGGSNYNANFFGTGSLQQIVPTIGANFTLGFELNNGTDDPFGSSSFGVFFDGSQVASFTNLDQFGQGYFLTTLPVTTSNALTTLLFTGSNVSGDWYLDDVTLVPVVANGVPEPSSILILGGALALLLSLSFTVAPRVRDARKGLPKSDLM